MSSEQGDEEEKRPGDLALGQGAGVLPWNLREVAETGAPAWVQSDVVRAQHLDLAREQLPDLGGAHHTPVCEQDPQVDPRPLAELTMKGPSTFSRFLLFEEASSITLAKLSAAQARRVAVAGNRNQGEGCLSRIWLVCFMCERAYDNSRSIKTLRYCFLETIKSLGEPRVPRSLKSDAGCKRGLASRFPGLWSGGLGGAECEGDVSRAFSDASRSVQFIVCSTFRLE